MKNSIKEGAYDGLPIEEYHADSAIGSSTLKSVYSKSPLHAKTGQSISAKAADYGTAFHMAILEPERFEVDVVRGFDDRRGGKWKDLIEANAGKTVLVAGEYDECCSARDSLYKSPTIQSLMDKKKATEQSIFWRDTETGCMLKARPDMVTTDYCIVDLKTTMSAKLGSFERDAFKYGYHIQHAHYLDGMHNVSFDGHVFLFLAVEKLPPYGWTIIEFDDDSKIEAAHMWRCALNKWAECKKQNSYPSYPEYQVMSLPKWVMPSMFDELPAEAE